MNWQFLYKTLAVMGFHPTFIGWIRVIYTNPKSRVRVNDGCCLDFFLSQEGGSTG